jgi:predicted nuclease of predicted toxin-antitoxin system
MIILLDENFPLRLYNKLLQEGYEAEHILLTHRGIHDKEIIVRLNKEELLFLTAYSDEIATDSEANRQSFRAKWHSEKSERSDAGILYIA